MKITARIQANFSAPDVLLEKRILNNGRSKIIAIINQNDIKTPI
jgi:hypothetical protein